MSLMAKSMTREKEKLMAESKVDGDGAGLLAAGQIKMSQKKFHSDDDNQIFTWLDALS
jgi:hypothetical protein